MTQVKRADCGGLSGMAKERVKPAWKTLGRLHGVWQKLRIDGLLVWGDQKEIFNIALPEPCCFVCQDVPECLMIVFRESELSPDIPEQFIMGEKEPSRASLKDLRLAGDVEALANLTVVPVDKPFPKPEVILKIGIKFPGKPDRRAMVELLKRGTWVQASFFVHREIGIVAKQPGHQGKGQRCDENGDDGPFGAALYGARLRHD